MDWLVEAEERPRGRQQREEEKPQSTRENGEKRLASKGKRLLHAQVDHLWPHS